MHYRDQIWTLASASITHSREASFGGRNSTFMSLHCFGWDPAKQAFVKGNVASFGVDPWHWTFYPCEPVLAEAFLTLCMSPFVQERFFTNSFASEGESRSYILNDRLTAFHRSSASFDGTRCTTMAGFSFQFYGLNWALHHVSLNAELARNFALRLKELDPASIYETLTTVQVAA